MSLNGGLPGDAMAKSKRAGNGMGSIRQRTDGRWEGRYTAPDGRQKSVYAKTQADVAKKLRGALHDIDSGLWREPSKMLISDWLGIWLRDYQGHNTARTVSKYKCIVNKHFVPVFGKLCVSKVLPLHVRRFASGLQSSGLSPVTVQNYVRILGTALQCAIEAGIIQTNPVDGVRLPRAVPSQFCVIDRAEIPAFIAAARAGLYSNELLLMLFTGLRVGEVRGLRWQDIDLDAATLSVVRQLSDVGGLVPPKYGEMRTIHIPREAVTLLRDQRKRQLEMRVKCGWHDDAVSRDLVFRLADGQPHNSRTIYRAVKAAGAAIGKPDLHPHDLRHSYAVAALRSGADVKTVQHNLGHKSAKMTLDVYAAYTDDAGRQSAEKLSEYLRNNAE